MGQAEQDPDLPRSASNVLCKVQSHLCLTEWWGKLKGRWDKSTLGAAYPAQKIVFCNRSVIDTKESDGIADPMEKIAIKSHSDHSDSGIGKMLILIDTYFVII